VTVDVGETHHGFVHAPVNLRLRIDVRRAAHGDDFTVHDGLGSDPHPAAEDDHVVVRMSVDGGGSADDDDRPVRGLARGQMVVAQDEDASAVNVPRVGVYLPVGWLREHRLGGQEQNQAGKCSHHGLWDARRPAEVPRALA